ncbi:MAG: selenocysteine-specific translation elongation factor [Verrucomicrobia bacterium]|nr:selenocysteine-specific translation elongation factor [Verrucomicrobiota bacterium]
MTLRKNIMLGTAGHVDHGKTALVRLLTGCETDTLEEEKERGLTIDLGFAPCQLSDQRVVGVVDVPGHVDFIRNMVAGAHGIDVVILVVAADDGIMPQTHEHLQILTLMGLRHGLVALTKVDLVDAGRRDFVIRELSRLLAGTFLAQAPICPLSTLTGEGYGEFYDALNRVVGACEGRPSQGLFRVWVEDVFTIRGSGTVVTGIPTSGVVHPGEVLWLADAGLSGRVRRMQVYGEDAAEGRAGECVALNLPELDHERVRRGMVLCGSESLEAVSLFEAELHLLESLVAPIKDGAEVQLHVGTASARAGVAMLERHRMGGGERQLVQIRLSEPLALVPGERFVLRANVSAEGQSRLITIGGGRILGTGNVRLRRQRPRILEGLAARRSALDDSIRWAELMVRESAAPMGVTELQRRCLLRADETAALIGELRSANRIVPAASGGFAHASTVEELAGRIVGAVAAFHAAQPQQVGLSREALATAVGGHREVFNLALESCLRGGVLAFNGAVYARPGWRPRVPDPEHEASEQAAALFQRAGWTPPTAEELAGALRVPVERAVKLTRYLLDRGVLVRLDDRLAMHREAVDRARQVALGLFRRAPSFTTMAFRDALGVSRKFAVPLLDHLDKVRFTARHGHDRSPGAEARPLLAGGITDEA